jgi:hypothetical protein
LGKLNRAYFRKIIVGYCKKSAIITLSPLLLVKEEVSMSIIHWDKSVLTLHLKEVLEDHHRGDSTALIGVGAILIGAIALPKTLKMTKPLIKQAIKTAIVMTNPKPPTLSR